MKLSNYMEFQTTIFLKKKEEMNYFLQHFYNQLISQTTGSHGFYQKKTIHSLSLTNIENDFKKSFNLKFIENYGKIILVYLFFFFNFY
jgi:hypothetical protein